MRSQLELPQPCRNQLLSYINMAKSRYEYVKQYEQNDRLHLNNWIVVRIDGQSFHKFSKLHNFEKPNDKNAIELMNHCAMEVMQDFKDIFIAYGESDEYSFILDKKTIAYNRRASKILSLIVSKFTASYVFFWNHYFKDTILQYAPSFDARIVLYPTIQEIKDYLAWRQADCHINNLYNTCFWKLVNKQNMTQKDAELKLRHTNSSDKNELLFTAFNINYNNIDAMFRKGSVLIRLPQSFIMTSNELEKKIITSNQKNSHANDTNCGINNCTRMNAKTSSLESKMNDCCLNDALKCKNDKETGCDSSATSEISSKLNDRKTRKLLKKQKKKEKTTVVVLHEDIIGKKFWKTYSWALPL